MKQRSFYLLLILLISSPLRMVWAQTIRYVTENGNGSEDGSSWINALPGTRLQEAINSSNVLDQVWVARGRYTPSPNDRTISFKLKSTVAVYGGFLGFEGNVAQRPAINPVAGQPSSTTLSGEIGDPAIVSDNSKTLVYNINVNNLAILDGFVLQGAYATDSDGIDGGGMYNVGSSPTLTNLTFQGNRVDLNGAGMCNDKGSSPNLTNCNFMQNVCVRSGGGMATINNSNPRLTNCRFSQNAAFRGGGVYVYDNSTPQLTNCVFIGNTADLGGGMNIQLASPTLQDCQFSENTAREGGGIRITESSSYPVLTGVTFSQNTATYAGGGIVIVGSNITLTNSNFTANMATEGAGGMLVSDAGIQVLTGVLFSQNTSARGGGLVVQKTSSPQLTQCTFTANTALTTGGGLENISGSNSTLTNCVFNQNTSQTGAGLLTDSSSPRFVNVRFSRNASVQTGGGVCINSGEIALMNCSFNQNSAQTGGAIRNYATAQLTNCILWNNGGQNTIFGNPVIANYCLFDPAETGYSGTNNLRVDPLFVDTDQDNLQLKPCSPAINVGDPASTTTNSGQTDLAEAPRFFNNGRIDLGAFEYQGTFDPNAIVAFTSQPPSAISVCAGTTVTASISASGPVTGYQWYKDNNLVTGQTSATLTLPNTTTASSGSYVAVVITNCSSITSTAFSLTVNPLPTVSINPSSTVVCSNQPVILTASGAATYRWNTSGPQTSSSISVTTTGTYSVTGTSIVGCSSTVIASVTVNSQLTLRLYSSGTLTCAQTSVTLTASAVDATSNGGTAYAFSGPNNFSQNGPSPTASVTAVGTYSVVVTGPNGCTATDQTTVTALQSPPTGNLSNSGPLSCTNPAVTLQATGGSSYELIRSIVNVNGYQIRQTEFSNTGFFSVRTPGEYSVIVRGGNGCATTLTTSVAGTECR